MKHETYNIPLYFGELHVFISNDFAKVNEKYKLKLDVFYHHGFDAVTGSFHKKSGFTRYFVIMRKKVFLKCIVHESKHLVDRIFQDRNIHADFSNDEPECYLLGWIFESIKKVL